jgi:hypothetical protein
MSAMLTLVRTECSRCGATCETVQRDRAIRSRALCCDLDDMVRLDPREAYGDDGEVACFYCGEPTRSPFYIGTRAFCCKSC